MNGKKSFKRIISFILVLTLILPSAVFAAGTAESDEKFVAGFTEYGQETIGVQDGSYVYSDSYFDGYSTKENEHLKTLSLIAALVSGSTGAANPADGPAHVKEFLGSLGFEDIEANKYFTLEPTAHSMGVCVGQKQIDGATLIAVMPRNHGYRNEWASNFDVGQTGLHEGFKEGRDEILRFLKNYVSEKKITGTVKVWITGYSRGAAVANLTAGFLADFPGWLGDNVKLSAGNVFAYTFATPMGAFEGVTADQAAVVAAAKYAADSRGEESDAFKYATNYTSKDEEVDYDAIRFAGIRNYLAEDDIVPMVVPDWMHGARYGVDTYYAKAFTTDARAKELFKEYAPDLFELFGEDDKSDVDDQATLIKTRVDILEALLDEAAQYVNALDSRTAYVAYGYQETFCNILLLAMDIMYGESVNEDLFINAAVNDAKDIAEAVLYLFTYSVAKQAEEAQGATGTALALSGTAVFLASDVIPDLLSDLVMNLASSGTVGSGSLDLVTGLKLLSNVVSGLENVADVVSEAAVQAAEEPYSVSASDFKDKAAASFRKVTKDAAEVLRTTAGNPDYLKALDTDKAALQAIEILEVAAMRSAEPVTPMLGWLGGLAALAELVESIESIVGAHMPQRLLAWCRANDSYFITDKVLNPEAGEEEDVKVALYTRPSVKSFFTSDMTDIYYTIDGTDPLVSVEGSAVTPESDSTKGYDANGITLKNCGFFRDYTIKAVTVHNGDVSPVWSFEYTTGNYKFGTDKEKDAYYTAKLLAEAVKGLDLNGQKMVEKFAEKLVNFVAENGKDALMVMAAELASKYPNIAARAIYDMAEELGTRIEEYLADPENKADAQTEIKGAILEVYDYLYNKGVITQKDVDLINKFVAELEEGADKLLDSEFKDVKQAIDEAKEKAAKKAGEKLREDSKEFREKAWEAFDDLVDKFVEERNANREAAKAWIDNAAEQAAENRKTFKENVENFREDVKESVQDARNYKDKVEDFVEKKEKAEESFKELIQPIVKLVEFFTPKHFIILK